MLTSKQNSNDWYKADLTPIRERDALDYELALMAQTIKGINTNVIRFSWWIREDLTREFLRCKRLSEMLTKEERSKVVRFLSTKTQEKSLFRILCDAFEQGPFTDDN